MSITLILDNITVALPKGYLSNSYPRLPIESSIPTMEDSTWGTPAVGGTAFKKHFWTIETIVDRKIADLLDELWEEYKYRQINQLPLDILLYDKTKTLKERLPRTRAIVPGTTETPTESGRIAYFAQFKAGFVSDLKPTRQGLKDGVSFTLKETVLVPA